MDKKDSKEKKVIKKKKLSKEKIKEYMEDVHIGEESLEGFIKPKKEIKPIKQAEYTIYKVNKFGFMANKYCGKFGEYLTKKYPEMFSSLYNSLKLSNIKVLSKTYVNIIIFSTIIASFGVFILTLLISALMGLGIFNIIIRAFAFTFLGGVISAAAIYFYPAIIVNQRRKAIKEDLPFVILHMAAVAGSGAQPISIFNLVLSSGEYKGLEAEIKKIVNYVNLFGYDLSTAMKAVSKTTPSPEFKELLVGIISTTETGGDLKSYLNGKAQDTMSTYKLNRKKYVESMGTYSDIYTGLLIAAPLLFSVTLKIIDAIAGQIGPFSVKTIAVVGVYGLIPLLNVGFLIFLNTIQPSGAK